MWLKTRLAILKNAEFSFFRANFVSPGKVGGLSIRRRIIYSFERGVAF